MYSTDKRQSAHTPHIHYSRARDSKTDDDLLVDFHESLHATAIRTSRSCALSTTVSGKAWTPGWTASRISRLIIMTKLLKVSLNRPRVRRCSWFRTNSISWPDLDSWFPSCLLIGTWYERCTWESCPLDFRMLFRIPAAAVLSNCVTFRSNSPNPQVFGTVASYAEAVKYPF